MNGSILAPAAILILWSLIMLVWMAATGLPALLKADLNLSAAGGRGQDTDPQLPPIVACQSHNDASYGATHVVLCGCGLTHPSGAKRCR